MLEPAALAACLARQHHVLITTDELFRFRNNEFDKIRCKLDSTESLRSFEKYPTPTVGLGISRPNAYSEWIPVYKAFHRIHRCGRKRLDWL